ncbi:MAG: hypothetical protein ACI4VT_00200 [Bacilli bacterium]
MNNFTFLTDEQIFGNNQLDIISRYGTKCAITDFSILLGGYVTSYYYTSEGNTRKDRTGWWWTKSSDGDNDAIVVSKSGDRSWFNVSKRSGGYRPALPYSSIQSISSNGLRGANGIKEIEYGEYPQTIVDENYSRELERAYNNRSLGTTGKNYTTDSVRYQDTDTSFRARTHTEYEYNGSKYIRFVGDLNCEGEVLSDGRTIETGQAYWVRVEPITWLVDERANIALSKKLIFSGLQFKNRRDYKGDFDRTDIKQFMDNYFSKEIVSDRVYSQTTSVEQTQSIEGKEPVRKQNPYGFNFDEVSEEDIIRGAVESNVSVFLHGRSSEGKSARVKQLDPDCEIIYMRNATPDSLNGKSVYNAATGEMIDVPPTWYSKVKEKCEAEPDKIHIIFFDELTNALPSIQGMAFNIVLDGEVNGKWKLPPNARIVAAGNDLNDSLAANRMAEPLFNRFAHVYINTTVDSWLKWASIPKEKYERLDYKEEEPETKIHPSVYAYIAYKSYSGHDVLRTPYTGDKPNADPRKWEMASKLLYKTKQPEMLRALIGDDLTRDFTAFARQQVISVEDVINHNYSSRDLEMDVSQKFATAVGLSSVDDEHFEVVRDFMKQVGAEPRAAFESMWTHGDERRLEKLAEVQMADSLSQGGVRR